MKKQSKRVHSILFPIFFLLACCVTLSQNKELDKIEKYVSYVYGTNGPGGAVLITKGGNILYERYLGSANLEQHVPISKASRFPVGSVTKQFTAAAILLLQERGILKVTDLLGKYLPAFPLEQYPVTLSQLLTHTSGIPSDNSSKDISKGIQNDIGPNEISEILQKTSLLFEPGRQYDYSNNGYILLGLVIEKVTGQTYQTFLKANLFEPLDMNQTTVGFYQDIIPNRVSGYREEEGITKNATYHASSFSAGAIISTPLDLKKWTTALFDGRVINHKSLSAMLTNYKRSDGTDLELGFGWEHNMINHFKCYEHSGFEPGYKAMTLYIPDEQLHLVVLQNTEMGSPVPVAVHIASIILGTPYPTPENSIALSQNKLQKFIGTYRLENDSERIIGLDSTNNLYIKAKGGISRKLHILHEKTLYYSQGYRQLHFEEPSDTGYTKFTYQNRSVEIAGTKISNQVPTENKALELSVAQLKIYVGTYKSPQFTMQVSLINDALYAQPEGSDRLMLVPKGAHQFFIKELGAEIQFDVTNDIESTQMNILLEGNQMKAIKQ